MLLPLSTSLVALYILSFKVLYFEFMQNMTFQIRYTADLTCIPDTVEKVLDASLMQAAE